MKLLVTGGGGFLGQAVCRRLMERGFQVASYNRGLYPALAAMGVRQVQGDLSNFDTVADASQGCDAVFHIGAKGRRLGQLPGNTSTPTCAARATWSRPAR